jgi:hypothetical protein
MNHRPLAALAVLCVSALPALAAPFCHLGPLGFEFSNRRLSWKLECQEGGACVMGWTRDDRSLLLRTVGTGSSGTLEAILDLPELKISKTLALDGGAGADQDLADFVRVFALDGKSEAPDGFKAFMAPFLQAINVEAEAGAAEGDPARNQALVDYCAARTGHGVGSLASVKRLMDAYRAAMTAPERQSTREHLAAFRAVPAQESLLPGQLRLHPLLKPTYISSGLPSAAALPGPAPAAAAEVLAGPAVATEAVPFTPAPSRRARSHSPRRNKENPAARALLSPAGAEKRDKVEPAAPRREFGKLLPISRD